MNIEKKLSENEWKSDVWIKVHRNEALLASILEVQALLIQNVLNIESDKANEIINGIIQKHLDSLIELADLTFDD